MVFTIPNFAAKSEWASPYPNIREAINNGITDSMRPRYQAEQLVQSMLENRVKGAQAEYARQLEQAKVNHELASIRHLNADAGLSGLRKQLLQSKINKAAYDQKLNDMLFSGAQSPTPSENQSQSFINPIKSASQNLIQPQISNQNQALNENIISQGNPNYYRFDELYDSDPRAKQLLEKKGFKKKQEIKYNSKTGVTTVITTLPSGKVTMTSIGQKALNGKSPLTTKTLSTLQLQKETIPQLKELINQIKLTQAPLEHKEIPFGLSQFIQPSARADYGSLINTGKDLFVKARGLNVTDKSLDTGEHVLIRKPYESLKAYFSRLDKLVNTLDNEERKINKTLNEGISTVDEPQLSNNDPLGIR